MARHISKTARGLLFAGKFLWHGIMLRKPLMFGFNVSERCPVDCSCYWRKNLGDRLGISAEQTKAFPILGRQFELSDDEVVRFFEQKRDQGYLMTLMIGGEPYVRPVLLERLGGIIPWSGIVTSGTTPLRRIKRTMHFVSVDGKDAETHDGVRQSPGLFKRLIKNVSDARATGNFPLAIHTVINAKNYRQIDGILDFWREAGLADWVIFSTHTSIEGAGDAHLRLTSEQRDEIVRDLFRARDQYGAFLNMSASMIRALSSQHAKGQYPGNCPTARFTEAYTGNGKKIERCIFGPGGNCDQCGCIVTVGFQPLMNVIPRMDDFQAALGLSVSH